MVKLIEGNYLEVMKKINIGEYKKIETYDTMLRYKNQGTLFGEPPVLLSTSVDMLKYDFADFDNNVLIILEKVDKRSKLYKHCKKNKTYYEFVYHESVTRIPPQYQTILGTIEDKGVFNNVVRQLNLLDSINDENFYAVIGNVGDINIFKTIDCLTDGEATSFLKGYQTLIEQGESPFKIMAMLRKKIENMIKLKTYENYDLTQAQQLSGLNYYFIKNNVVRVKKLPRTTLINWYKLVTNTQYEIVTGKIEEGIAINNLFLELFTPLLLT